MTYLSTFTVAVRAYEIDVYDHVNNAVYIQWLEEGRSKFLLDKGFNYINIIEAWGVRFMTVRTEIDYRRALVLGESARIDTSVERFGNTSVTFRQVITRVGDDNPAAEARVVIVFTSSKTGRPIAVPEEFKRLYG
jgi:YbgC/YbaW family acyl-CoA thioester hydrolase